MNTETHDAAIGLSVDGQSLFIYQDEDELNDIYLSTLEGESWSVPVKLKGEVNTPYPERSVCLSGDGKYLFFESDKPGGFGGRDIYFCEMDNQGNWNKVKNIGAAVNTPYDEDGIFFHPNGRYLFFSSKGHSSMGGYDIFRSELIDGHWSEPVNLGYPINTPGDDIFFVLSSDGKTGCFSSYRPDGFGDQDIFSVDLSPVKSEKKSLSMLNKMTLLSGYVFDLKSKAPLEVNIQVSDNKKSEIISSHKSNAKTGKYLLTIPAGVNYNITFEKNDYLFSSLNVNSDTLSAYKEVKKDVFMSRPEVGEKIILQNLFFEFDKSSLTKESIMELEKLTSYLNNYADIKIFISGHTDNIGSDAYNQKLSEKRAMEVVNFLVFNGIDRARLKYKGYGKISPLVPNVNEDGSDNPENRKINRRTEFEVVY